MASTPRQPRYHGQAPAKSHIIGLGHSGLGMTGSALPGSDLGKLLLQRKMDRGEVLQYTESIAEQVLTASRVMDSCNFAKVGTRDLRLMAELYDQIFFDSRLLSLASRHGLTFRWSSRMTSAGGKTTRTTVRQRLTGEKKISYEIALSATLLFHSFSDLQRPIRVTGYLCHNRMQAMQRILEHELIHLGEMLVWDDSNCAAGRFQNIAGRLFGHTEHKHDLVTQQERAAKNFNVRIGEMVTFQLEQRRYIGRVNRITRRATVLVADARGQLYGDGKRYSKFYVPISQLSKV